MWVEITHLWVTIYCTITNVVDLDQVFNILNTGPKQRLILLLIVIIILISITYKSVFHFKTSINFFSIVN